jgi:hypothetical protein
VTRPPLEPAALTAAAAAMVIACGHRAPITTGPVTSRQSATAAAAPAASDTALRAELLAMEREDQEGRADIAAAVARKDTLFMHRMMAGDSLRTARLQAIVAARGWPTPALVGRDGVFAAWLVLQHSPDYAWQERLLPTLERAAAAGDVARSDLALLTDRVLRHAGKPQRYGSQFSMVGDRLVADPIEDEANVDARRAAIGLPSMAEYARVLGEVYKVPVEWPRAAPPQ